MSRLWFAVLPMLFGMPLAAQVVESRPLPLPQDSRRADAASQDSAASDPAAQLAQLRKLAESGDKDAPFQLGVLYLIGQGVSQDGAQAEQYFKKADMSPARACFVAEAYIETSLPGRLEAATRWVKTANAGCSWWELADWYGSNRLGPDLAKEIEYLKQGLAAKDDGYHRAMRARLGELLLTGTALDGSPAERAAWIGEAARQRLGQAEWMIAMNAAQHPDDSDSPSASLEWIRHAARYGNPSALAAVGQSAMSRDISDLSYMDGMALFELGARQTMSAVGAEAMRKQLEPEQRQELDDYEAAWQRVVSATGGYYAKHDALRFSAPLDIDALAKLAVPENPDAQVRLAYAYESKGELEKAEALYREVADHGGAPLWLALAETAAKAGKWARASDLYASAAEAGSHEACAHLARIDAEGLAGKKDPVGAYLWLLLSESNDTALLADRKKVLSAEQLKSVALAQAQWLVAHQDHWKGDVKAAEKLINDDRYQTMVQESAARGRMFAPPPPPAKSLQAMRRMANAGDKESAFEYALELLRGNGSPQAGVAVIQRYAAMGPADPAHKADIAAAFERAAFLDDATRRKYAMNWWKAVGGARGYYQLAEMYYGKSDGTVETEDEKQAVAWWQKSAGAGEERWARLSRMKLGYCVVKGWSSGNWASDAVWAHELAMEMLGKEYYQVAGEYSYGRELEHNQTTYLHLVERAAIYNIDNAQGVMAQEIIQGNWKQRDDMDAYSWLKLQGLKQDAGGRQQVQVAEENPELKRKIEARYAQLLETRKASGAYYPQDDPLRAAEIADLEPRARAQDPEAEFRLASLLEKRGSDADVARAIAFYHDLWAMAGPQVRLTWGRTLMYGTDGMTRDDIGAEKWLWDAADAGSKEACGLLAAIYGEGRGFAADPVAAEAWRVLAGEGAGARSLTDEQRSAVAARVADWRQKHPKW